MSHHCSLFKVHQRSNSKVSCTKVLDYRSVWDLARLSNNKHTESKMLASSLVYSPSFVFKINTHENLKLIQKKIKQNNLIPQFRAKWTITGGITTNRKPVIIIRNIIFEKIIILLYTW